MWALTWKPDTKWRKSGFCQLVTQGEEILAKRGQSMHGVSGEISVIIPIWESTTEVPLAGNFKRSPFGREEQEEGN